MESTPSVLNTGQSTEKSKWTRKQNRHFHTINSILTVWENQGYSILWLMLTTARNGDPGALRVNLRELERRARKKAKVGKIEHVVVDTTEGNGVLHVLWAAKESLYVEQRWLSEEWGKIHGATYVWVARYKRGSGKQLGRYMVSQYMSGQKGAGVRISWSWKTTVGGPLKYWWRVFKAAVKGNKKQLIEKWQAFLRDEKVEMRANVWAWRPYWAGANFRYHDSVMRRWRHE